MTRFCFFPTSLLYILLLFSINFSSLLAFCSLFPFFSSFFSLYSLAIIHFLSSPNAFIFNNMIHPSNHAFLIHFPPSNHRTVLYVLLSFLHYLSPLFFLSPSIPSSHPLQHPSSKCFIPGLFPLFIPSHQGSVACGVMTPNRLLSDVCVNAWRSRINLA